MPEILTPEQIDAFDRWGVLRFDGLLSVDRVRRARELVQRQLATLGLWRDGSWRLDALPRPQWPDHGLKTSRVVGNRHPELEALAEEPALRAVVDKLMDGRPFDRTIYRRPSLLFTLPNADAWTMPNGWHADGPRLASGERPGVQLFAFLDTVEPGGGGTVVVAGSHRLLADRPMRTRELNNMLRREPFFRELMVRKTPVGGDGRARLMCAAGAVDNIALEVLELTGAPGDAYIIDLRTLHSGAPNAAERPRMMVTDRYLRADLIG